MALTVRPETVGDRQAVFAVNAAAFETPSEADLVEALRASEQPTVSLVAELYGQIVGHILFSPVVAEADASASIMGLGPMAVTPEHQGEGIGSALVRAGPPGSTSAGKWASAPSSFSAIPATIPASASNPHPASAFTASTTCPTMPSWRWSW